VNQQTAIFQGHGTQDPVVPYSLGLAARQQLEAAGYRVRWHTYQLPHSVSPEEVRDLATWLREVLP
jgi:phospholipase/carboxylesterase